MTTLQLPEYAAKDRNAIDVANVARAQLMDGSLDVLLFDHCNVAIRSDRCGSCKWGVRWGKMPSSTGDTSQGSLQIKVIQGIDTDSW